MAFATLKIIMATKFNNRNIARSNARARGREKSKATMRADMRDAKFSGADRDFFDDDEKHVDSGEFARFMAGKSSTEIRARTVLVEPSKVLPDKFATTAVDGRTFVRSDELRKRKGESWSKYKDRIHATKSVTSTKLFQKRELAGVSKAQYLDALSEYLSELRFLVLPIRVFGAKGQGQRMRTLNRARRSLAADTCVIFSDGVPAPVVGFQWGSVQLPSWTYDIYTGPLFEAARADALRRYDAPPPGANSLPPVLDGQHQSFSSLPDFTKLVGSDVASGAFTFLKENWRLVTTLLLEAHAYTLVRDDKRMEYCVTRVGTLLGYLGPELAGLTALLSKVMSVPSVLAFMGSFRSVMALPDISVDLSGCLYGTHQSFDFIDIVSRLGKAAAMTPGTGVHALISLSVVAFAVHKGSMVKDFSFKSAMAVLGSKLLKLPSVATPEEALELTVRYLPIVFSAVSVAFATRSLLPIFQSDETVFMRVVTVQTAYGLYKLGKYDPLLFPDVNAFRQGVESVCKEVEPMVKRGSAEALRHWRTLEEIRADLRNSKAGEWRMAPFTVAIVGESGVGKSNLLYLLIAALTTAHYGKAATQSEIYTRNMLDKFWSGYHDGVKAVIFDDLGNTKLVNGIAGVNPTEPIIAVCNNISTMLSMADVESKGKITFQSLFVFITSNIPDLHASVYSNCTESVLRRVNFFVEPSVLPDFRRPGTMMLDAAKVPLSSVCQVPTLHSFRLWTVYRAEGQAANEVTRAYENLPPDFSTVDLLSFMIDKSRLHFACQARLQTDQVRPNLDASSLLTYRRQNEAYSVARAQEMERMREARNAPVFVPADADGVVRPPVAEGVEAAPVVDAQHQMYRFPGVGVSPSVAADFDPATMFYPEWIPPYDSEDLYSDDSWGIYPDVQTEAPQASERTWYSRGVRLYRGCSAYVTDVFFSAHTIFVRTALEGAVMVLMGFIEKAYHVIVTLALGSFFVCNTTICGAFWIAACVGYATLRRWRQTRLAIAAVVRERANIVMYSSAVALVLFLLVRAYKTPRKELAPGNTESTAPVAAPVVAEGGVVAEPLVALQQGVAEFALQSDREPVVVKANELPHSTVTTTFNQFRAMIGPKSGFALFATDKTTGVGVVVPICQGLYATCKHIISPHLDAGGPITMILFRHMNNNASKFLLYRRNFYVPDPQSDIAFISFEGPTEKDITARLLPTTYFRSMGVPTSALRFGDAALLMTRVPSVVLTSGVSPAGQLREEMVRLTGVPVVRSVRFSEDTQNAIVMLALNATVSGDCGSPFVISLNSGATHTPMLAGVHSGMCAMGTQRFAVVAPLHVDMVADARRHFETVTHQSLAPRLFGQPDKLNLDGSRVHPGLQQDCVTQSEFVDLVGVLVDSRGVNAQSINTSRSALRRGVFYASESLDNILGPLQHTFPHNMSSLDHFSRPLANMTVKKNDFDPSILAAAKEDFMLTVVRIAEGEVAARPFSIFEAVNTVPGKLSPLPMNTSAGFGRQGCKSLFMVRACVAGCADSACERFHPSATDAMAPGRDNWYPDPPLLREIEALREALAEGKRDLAIFKASLKDEAVAVGKTKVRAFYVGSAALSIVTRMYIGPALAALHGKPDYECAVQLNVMSESWEKLQVRIEQHDAANGNTDRLAGDYSNYDLSTHAELLSGFYEAIVRISELALWSAYDLRVLRGLAVNLCNPVYILLGQVVRVKGSNPSGIACTTDANSGANCILHRYAFYAKNPGYVHADKSVSSSKTLFSDSVALTTYGDDAFGSVALNGPSLPITNADVARAAALFGMTYGALDKSGGEHPPYYPAHRADFLKCSSVYDEAVGFRIGRLPLSSIRKSLAFERMDTFESRLSTMQSALQLYYPHCVGGSREENMRKFGELRTIFSERLLQLDGCRNVDSALPTYDDVVSRIRGAQCEACQDATLAGEH